ncbi:TPA: phage head closure protein [Morganella morganii subsp. morganii]|nr:phage head closure protein [Morganella morganii subsp. morganii]HDT3134093.1 phage head closure protein [Morganella morganii subsp. morganii]
MSGLRAGELNKRIILYRPEVVTGELGDSRTELTKVITVWAKAEAISNRKIRAAEQDQVIETMQFTARPRADVQIDWVIEYQNRFFTVRACDRNDPAKLIITTEADIRHDRK